MCTTLPSDDYDPRGECAQVLRNLTDTGLQPNTDCYKALAHAYAACGQMDRVVDVVPTMVAAGVRPTAEFFNALISLYGKVRTVLQRPSRHPDLQALGRGQRGFWVETFFSGVHCCCR